MAITTSHFQNGLDVCAEVQNAAARQLESRTAQEPASNVSLTSEVTSHAPTATVTTSPSRARLAEFNRRVERLEAELDMKRRPQQRLQLIISTEELARADYERHSLRHAADLEEWIATGCRGDRPEPSPELKASEREFGLAAENAKAASTVLSAANQDIAAKSQELDHLKAARNMAHTEALIEAIEQYRDGVLVPSIASNYAAKKTIRDLIDWFTSRGDRPMVNRINGVLDSVTVPAPVSEPSKGREFVARLLIDPMTERG
jgi:hypothetical protein